MVYCIPGSLSSRCCSCLDGIAAACGAGEGLLLSLAPREPLVLRWLRLEAVQSAPASPDTLLHEIPKYHQSTSEVRAKVLENLTARSLRVQASYTCLWLEVDVAAPQANSEAWEP